VCVCVCFDRLERTTASSTRLCSFSSRWTTSVRGGLPISHHPILPSILISALPLCFHSHATQPMKARRTHFTLSLHPSTTHPSYPTSLPPYDVCTLLPLSLHSHVTQVPQERLTHSLHSFIHSIYSLKARITPCTLSFALFAAGSNHCCTLSFTLFIL
jgi:hypothetical protein